MTISLRRRRTNELMFGALAYKNKFIFTVNPGGLEFNLTCFLVTMESKVEHVTEIPNNALFTVDLKSPH